jgi:hypothetical protein
MPWQRLVADVGGELLEDGRPAYREVWVTVPRQCGKTTLILAWELDRCLSSIGPQRVIYSAQNGGEAAKKLVDDQAPLIEASPFKAARQKVYRANGSEAITFKNGSRIDVLRDSESAGHGKTLDLAVIDEAFADVDFRREQALLPAMRTRRHAQILGASTAGTEASLYLKQKFETGRQAVLSGQNSKIAFFEWSADPDADPDDPATWWSCIPALGYTVDEDVIQHERMTQPDGEFRRASLNQWTTSDERVIPATSWDAVCFEDVRPDGSVVFAFDVNEERSAAAVAVADASGAVQLIDHRPGVGWIVERLVEVTGRHRASVALDGYGPAGSFVQDLEQRGVKVTRMSGNDVAQACGAFYDAVIEQKVRIRRHEALDAAAAGANRKLSGDSWKWARRGASVDVSPLVAVTLAYRAAQYEPPLKPTFAY